MSREGKQEKDRRVLFISPVTPAFSGGGLPMRAASLLQALAAEGWTIRLAVIPIFHQPEEPLDETIRAQCETYQHLNPPPSPRRLSRLQRWRHRWFPVPPSPLPGPPFQNPRWGREIERSLGRRPGEMLFVFRLLALRLLLPRQLRSAPFWFDMDEVDSAAAFRAARFFESQGSLEEARLHHQRTAAYLELEKKLLPLSRRIFVSSATERNRLPERWRGKGRLLPNIMALREPLPPRPPMDGPYRLLYVGTFGYPPNVDAIFFFCRDIAPLLRRELKRPFELVVAGPDPNRKLEPLRGTEGLHLTGWVEKLEPLYAETDLVIVPLRMGAGTRLKILEAFSHGRAVVATTVGAEGLDVTSGETLWLADTAEEFSRACAGLLHDRTRRQDMARSGYAYYQREHTPAALRRRLAAALAEG